MIEYTKGYKYQLTRDGYFKVLIYPAKGIMTEYITLTTKGDLFIRKGYAWDGASGPMPDIECVMQASLIHDALYQLMRMGLLHRKWRYEADRILRDTCIEDGMWEWCAGVVYNGVRGFAGFAADPKNRKKIYRAGNVTEYQIEHDPAFAEIRGGVA